MHHVGESLPLKPADQCSVLVEWVFGKMADLVERMSGKIPIWSNG
jgi:hypothetical protein